MLIDAGFNYTDLVKRLKDIGTDIKDINAILITHEHLDHVRGVKVLSKKLKIPVYVNEATKKACHYLDEVSSIIEFETDKKFQIGEMMINPFHISHDASDPVGFLVYTDNVKIGVATDLGIVTNEVREKLMGSDILIIESNHDVRMVKEGPYPWHLKKRILGTEGHLSNEECLSLLEDLLHPNLRHIFLAHISKVNNSPSLAFVPAESIIKNKKMEETSLHLSWQDYASSIAQI